MLVYSRVKACCNFGEFVPLLNGTTHQLAIIMNLRREMQTQISSMSGGRSPLIGFAGFVLFCFCLFAGCLLVYWLVCVSLYDYHCLT